MTGNCLGCGIHGVLDRAHIKTRGSGAGWDDDEWVPLCRTCHIKSGQIGWYKFAGRRPKIMKALYDRGFLFVKEGSGENQVWKLRRKA